ASVIAFDAEKGSVRWKGRAGAAGYASPVVFGTGPGRRIVLLTGSGLVALRPEDGTTDWEFPLRDILGMRSVTPVCVGDLILTTSMTSGRTVRVGLDKGKPAPVEVWKNADLTSYFSTPVAMPDGTVYQVTNVLLGEKVATLRCLDARTGKEHWHKDRVGK